MNETNESLHREDLEVTHITRSFSDMHADHRLWASEHSMWNDDIELWHRQHASALTQLKTLEDLILQHGECLDAHAQQVGHIQRSVEGHEASMAAYRREGADAEGQEAMCANHSQQSERHAKQREAHERIKKHHHTVMAHLTMLKAAIEAAM